MPLACASFGAKKLMEPLDTARSVIRLEIEGLEAMLDRLDGSFTRAIEILNHAITERGKIVVVGVGKSGNIGHKIAATFNSTGSTAVVLNSQNALHGDLGLLSDDDAVLALEGIGVDAETDRGAVISPRVRAAVRHAAASGGSAFVLVHRHGYAPAFRCVPRG